MLDMGDEATPWLATLLRRYRNLNTQSADGALMYLAERAGIETVFTLDRRDFTLHHLAKNRRVKILPVY